MRVKKWIPILALSMLCGGCGGVADENASSSGNDPTVFTVDNTSSPMNQRVGITHWGGRYMPDLGDRNSLILGAEKILATGTKVLKISCAKNAYPLDDFSSLQAKECADFLKYAPYKSVFEMDFETFFINITEVDRAVWKDGMSEQEKNKVKQEFYNATKYLLETYEGSGKTFILQNWETDNYVLQSSTGGDEAYLFRKYAEYFNARQDGINQARKDFQMQPSKKVFVFGALEINRLSLSYSGAKALDYTVPYTYADLYAYSSYEYKDKGVVSSKTDVKNALINALSRYEEKLPDPKFYPQPCYFGQKRLAITEFGYPDKADGYGGSWQKTVAEGTVLSMREKVQYAVYWQLCCNEVIGSAVNATKNLGASALRQYAFTENDFNGFYLLKPNGDKVPTYDYLEELFKGK